MPHCLGFGQRILCCRCWKRCLLAGHKLGVSLLVMDFVCLYPHVSIVSVVCTSVAHQEVQNYPLSIAAIGIVLVYCKTHGI
jgi:hypothetical protein